MEDAGLDRRRFLRMSAKSGVLLMPAYLVGERRARSQTKEKQEEEVAPPEDLMREHGVLKRVLLVYREVIRRVDAHEEVRADSVRDAAGIIRQFIEDYHEKLEEDHLFPRFEKAHKLADLTTVLRAQHQAGRRLTEQITQAATQQAFKDPSSARQAVQAMQQFIRMYEPHEAREDTVLFPALR